MPSFCRRPIFSHFFHPSWRSPMKGSHQHLNLLFFPRSLVYFVFMLVYCAIVYKYLLVVAFHLSKQYALQNSSTRSCAPQRHEYNQANGKWRSGNSFPSWRQTNSNFRNFFIFESTASSNTTVEPQTFWQKKQMWAVPAKRLFTEKPIEQRYPCEVAGETFFIHVSHTSSLNPRHI